MSDHRHLYDAFDSELCLIGAATDEALVDEVHRLRCYLDQVPQSTLEDIAYTCAYQARNQPCIVALVASSLQDLRLRLDSVHKKLSENVARIRDKNGVYFSRERMAQHGRIAFLFPGVTSFYPDMLRDLNLVFDDCRSVFDELEEAIRVDTRDSFIPSDYIFPPSAIYRDSHMMPADLFSESLIATHAANLAFFRLFERISLHPDGLLGFSGGDFAALDVAGVYGALSRNKRIQFMREGYTMLNSLTDRDDLPQCAMLVVIDAPANLLTELCERYPGRVVISSYDSARQHVLALSPEIYAETVEQLQKANARCVQVPMKWPFSTPWCAKVLPTIRQFLSHWVRHVPRIPVYSCATADRLSVHPRDILTVMSDQWISPVLFEETIRTMYADRFRIFIEVGARGNMTTTIDEILRFDRHLAVAVNRIHRSGITQLHHALAQLAAHGVRLDLTALHAKRRRNLLDFDHPLAALAQTRNVVSLHAHYPVIQAFAPTSNLFPKPAHVTPTESVQKNLPDLVDHHRLAYGAEFPMLANAEVLEEQPGISIEASKTISLEDYPFLKDYAVGTSQLSFSEPDLHGLTILSLASGLEIMAEAARKLLPASARLIEVDNLRAQRWIGFERGAVKINIKAERIASTDPSCAAIKVQLRDDTPNSAFTWPIFEATLLLNIAGEMTHPTMVPIPLTHPRQVNWSSSEIYPERLFHGGALRSIRHVDQWSEEGVNFELEVPSRSEAVRYTRIPLFTVWPQLLDGITSAFALWRSHEKFFGAISLPFRARRISFHAANYSEGARLRGYLRLTSVTPRSHIADINVSDGNGNLLIHIKGWEEICERIPDSYHRYILKPAERFISEEVPLNLFHAPTMPIATAFIAEPPIKIFEQNQEIWLRAMAYTALSQAEREDWLEMQGATSRRVEWLFGRIAAKESVRRYLLKQHLSRWTSADVRIWPDDSGKPHPLGSWSDVLKSSEIDLSIAHTSKLVVAAVAAHTHIGIDIETLGRDLSDDFIRGVFTPHEIELAARCGEGPVGLLKFWCGKEAISKALGTGIRYSPQDLHIDAADPVTGTLHIQLQGQWLDSFKKFTGRKNPVQTTIFSGHAFASCLLPNTLFT